MAYIKDSVIGCFKKQLCELEHNPDKFSRVKAKFLKNYVIVTLEASKTDDVVEVVRCKDCDRSAKYKDYYLCGVDNRAVNADSFCSYGERK